MNLFRFATYLTLRYSLGSLANEEEKDIPEPVKKKLKDLARAAYNDFRKNHIDGKGAGGQVGNLKNQVLLELANKTGEIYGKAPAIANKIVTDAMILAVDPSLSAKEMYEKTRGILALSKMLETELIARVKGVSKRDIPNFNKLDLGNLQDAEVQFRTTLRRLSGLYDEKALYNLKKILKDDVTHSIDKNILENGISLEDEEKIEVQNLGGYEMQKPVEFTGEEIGRWAFNYNNKEKALYYGLDDGNFRNKLISNPHTKLLLDSLIRELDRSKHPFNPDSIKSGYNIKKLNNFYKAEKLKGSRINTDFFEDEKLERARQHAVPEEELWNLNMQNKKLEKSFEESEEARALKDQERIAPSVQKRDEEHIKREDDFKSKYSSLRLKQIMEKYK